MNEIVASLVGGLFPLAGIFSIYLAWHKRRSPLFWSIAGILFPIVGSIVLAFFPRRRELDKDRWTKHFVWAAFVVTVASTALMLVCAVESGKSIPQPKSSGPGYKGKITFYRDGTVKDVRTTQRTTGRAVPTQVISMIALVILGVWALHFSLDGGSEDRLLYGSFLFALWIPFYWLLCFFGWQWPIAILQGVIMIGSFYVLFQSFVK